MNSRPKVCIIEDNSGDIDLIQEAVRQAGIACSLSIFKDGSEAISYFQNLDSTQKDLPKLILLDLNLPKVDGFEVLKFVKTQAKYSQIPVVVFTSSAAEEDVKKSYSLQANCFVTKPFSLEKYTSIVGKICEFWLDTARLPQKFS